MPLPNEGRRGASPTSGGTLSSTAKWLSDCGRSEAWMVLGLRNHFVLVPRVSLYHPLRSGRGAYERDNDEAVLDGVGRFSRQCPSAVRPCGGGSALLPFHFECACRNFGRRGRCLRVGANSLRLHLHELRRTIHPLAISGRFASSEGHVETDKGREYVDRYSKGTAGVIYMFW